MKRFTLPLIVALVLGLALPGWAQKISDLPATSTAAATSILPIVVAPGSSTTASKITVPNLGATLIANQPAFVSTAAIGVSVQGYNASTTTLGNTTTGTGSTIMLNAGPTITGDLTVSSINGNVLTAGSGTLTLGAGKTATLGNTVTINGTDGTTMTMGTTTGNVPVASQHLTVTGSTAATTLTLPSTAAISLGAINVSQTYTGTPTFSAGLLGTATSDFTIGGQTTRLASTGIIFLTSGASLNAHSSSNINWNNDTFLYRDAAATIQLGADAAGVTNQTLKAADRITTDGVGADLTIAGGRNRGASNGGSILFQTSPQAGAGATGTLATRLTIASNGNITPAGKIIVPMGEVSYFNTTGTEITISGTSDGSTNMVVVAPTTAVSGMEYEADNGGGNTGRLRYTGATTRMFHVAITVSGSPATANDVFVFGCAKNGTVVAQSKVLGSTSGTQFSALHAMVELATNEYIELYVGNTSGSRNFTVKSLNLFMMGL